MYLSVKSILDSIIGYSEIKYSQMLRLENKWQCLKLTDVIQGLQIRIHSTFLKR